MRITNRQLTTNYLYNANSNLEKFSKQQEKLETGRAYNRISQNVPSAKRALQARTEMYRNEQYQKNVDAALDQYAAAEEGLTEINDDMQEILAIMEKALNGTNNDPESREIFCETLEQAKESMMKSLNAGDFDKFVFGGTNNKTIPFKTDEDGNLTFNGVNVDDITKNKDVYFDADGNEVPNTKDRYVDIGMGLRMVGDDFDKDSAFKMTVSAIDSIGHGLGEISYTDKNGDEVTEEVSNNMYQIMSDMQDALKENDMGRLGALRDHLKNQHNQMLVGIAEIGAKTKKLGVVREQLDDKNVRIAETQKKYEGIEDTDEIVKMKEYQYSWQLTLQFGGNLLPQSLMDYIK